MNVIKITPKHTQYPDLLRSIATAPKQLFVLGTPLTELINQPLIAVVGSRKVSPYGRQITRKISGELAEKGIVIVSGLALGVDSIAHEAALEAKGKTIAVLPCGLDEIYPASHTELARRILKTGGTLVSEYPSGTEPYKTNFVARNRIIAGLSAGVLITEAAEKSGSLHTANFALEQGREVMAVPGNITSPNSAGTNQLIRSGAALISSTDDVLGALGISPVKPKNKQIIAADNAEEFTILTLISNGINDTELLLKKSGLQPAQFSQTLTMLEIKGSIKASGGNWFGA